MRAILFQKENKCDHLRKIIMKQCISVFSRSKSDPSDPSRRDGTHYSLERVLAKKYNRLAI